ncbi:glycosyltransferase family 21 protein [Myriangium duriaei CBS 260.36]|uniref:Ceramide glucosyltransferase n=1 Tax=Myriangium duriaei CBS 260.36 TaxID=1168546 RepID=A0A9P4J4Z7_9PEZI|nr:glycosyltransferase family 21 protein [Myriangium duriaei CBS 260.36]
MVSSASSDHTTYQHPSIGDGTNPLAFTAALACLIWYTTVMSVTLLGYTQLWRYYSKPRPQSKSSISTQPPQISIIRPVKGLEPNLYECLAATFRQDYPPERLTIRFCVADPKDPSLPILKRLLTDFPTFDARIVVESEDVVLQTAPLGPNPKIRNMSRAYREASGDIIWIVDCNVWVAKGTLGRMVDTLKDTPAKFVHLLPLVVDVTDDQSVPEAANLLSNINGSTVPSSTSTQSSDTRADGHTLSVMQYGGGRLEELFMSSSHAKFYTAINTVLIAPCIVGKSTMFRKSHLDGLTDGRGIDYFSENICEDHLIGDLLWKRQVPQELAGEKWSKHAMVFGDFAIQPMAGMSVGEYIARRVRWLRVRKFTVVLATLVEPGTESFLCSLYGAFAATTFGFLPATWLSFLSFWLISVSLWAALDWTLYLMLHSGASIDVDENTPAFSRPLKTQSRRPFKQWLCAWLGRETLAFPIWAWAVYGGVTVTWRGKRFRVGLDMKVHEISGTQQKRHD